MNVQIVGNEEEDQPTEPEFVSTARDVLKRSAGQSFPDLEETVLWSQNNGSDWRVFFATNISESTRYLVEYVNDKLSITMVTDEPMPEVVDDPKE